MAQDDADRILDPGAAICVVPGDRFGARFSRFHSPAIAILICANTVHLPISLAPAAELKGQLDGE